jgi:hypothetical protein
MLLGASHAEPLTTIKAAKRQTDRSPEPTAANDVTVLHRGLVLFLYELTVLPRSGQEVILQIGG